MYRTFVVLPTILLFLSGCAGRSLPPREPLPAEGPHLRNIRQLTFDGDNGEAYFSWDGTRLIWQSNRGGAGCDKIWVMNADGTGKRRVSPARGAHTCSFFFPGDRKIVYASTAPPAGDCPPRPAPPPGRRYVWPLFPYDIFVADADGSNPVRITDNPAYDAEPIVSPDGTKIVFGSKRDGDFDIYVMDADGSNVRRLTRWVGYDGGPWWSPDGTKIVWRAWHPQTPEEKDLWRECMENDYIVPVPLDLWVMDADGSNQRRILANGATNWAPSWHPDGRRIVFSSNMDDWRPELDRYGHNFELYLIGLDGTGLERITFNRVFDGFPMFGPDGKRLVWASNRNPRKPRVTDIFVAEWVE